MPSIQSIEQAIEQLPALELAEFQPSLTSLFGMLK
jgi:hypothetical protein